MALHRRGRGVVASRRKRDDAEPDDENDSLADDSLSDFDDDDSVSAGSDEDDADDAASEHSVHSADAALGSAGKSKRELSKEQPSRETRAASEPKVEPHNSPFEASPSDARQPQKKNKPSKKGKSLAPKQDGHDSRTARPRRASGDKMSLQSKDISPKSSKGGSSIVAGPSQDLGAEVVDRGNQDTEAMLNGMKIDETKEAVDFEEFVGESVADADSKEKTDVDSRNAQPPTAPKMESPLDKRRREHEEYKKKRDSDPKFVPNRGAFFMHDHRSSGAGANGFRPFPRFGPNGRGLGRGFNRVQPAAYDLDSPWQHDMHETVAVQDQAGLKAGNNFKSASRTESFVGNNQNPPRGPHRQQQKPAMQIIVKLPPMEHPIVFREVPQRDNQRFPIHRAPLRRDKPVRIFLPGHPVRYIFPTPSRSFVFIPRAMRPNNPQYMRGSTPRGRSMFGVYGSRTRSDIRSAYSPSIGGHSRRSSIMMDSRHQSPAVPGQFTAPPPVAPPVQSAHAMEVATDKPAVRLPPTANQSPQSASPSKQWGKVGSQIVPPENRPTPPALLMHQPRPQKNISVENIESPSHNYPMPNYMPQQFAPQPFYHQLYDYGGPPAPGVFYPGMPYQPHPQHAHHLSQHSRNGSLSSRPSGTPLSHIPEGAIHAAPFRPGDGSYTQHQFYGTINTPPPPPPYRAHTPSRPTGYTGPTEPMEDPAASTSAVAPNATATQTASGVPQIAQESNGMVYYFDPAQYYQNYGSQGGDQGTPATEQGNEQVSQPAPPQNTALPAPMQMMPMVPVGPNGMMPMYYYPQAYPQHMQHGAYYPPY